MTWCARCRCRGSRWARRRAGSADRWRARARSRRAAARRPRAATDSDGARSEPDFRQQRVGAARRDRRAGDLHRHEHVLEAVSDGSRWKNWKTNPIRLPRSRASASSASAVMSTPSITMRPVDGASRPASRPSSVDLPLPDGPVIATTRPDSMRRSSGCRIVSIASPLGTVLETPRSSIMKRPASDQRLQHVPHGVGHDLRALRFGWMPSAWLSVGSPATLSSRNGRNVHLCSARQVAIRLPERCGVLRAEVRRRLHARRGSPTMPSRARAR